MGATFEALLGQLAVGGLALTITTLAARGPIARRTPVQDDRSDALDPFEAALLAGGPPLAVAAAVQALVARGALELVPGAGRVRPLGERPSRLPPLEAAALRAIARGQDAPAALEAALAEDLRGLEAALAGRGLRPSEARRAFFRLAPRAALVALWAGVFYVAAEAGPGPVQPAAGVVAVVFSVVLAAASLMEAPRRTARAAALLKALRERHRDRARERRARNEVLDAHDAALYTALFGAGAAIGPLVAVGDRPWRARTDIDGELGEALDDNGDGGGDAGDAGGGDGGGGDSGCGGGGCGGGGD